MDQKGLNQPVTTGGVRLPTFYNGRVLTAEDLQQLQAAEGALRQQVARSSGSGVAWGLTCTASSKTIEVEAGLAVGADGTLLYLAKPVEVAIAGLTTKSAAVGFQDCGLKSAPLSLTGEAPYLLVVGPAQSAVDSSPQVWPTGSGKISTCGPGSTELGVQFRLLALPWGGSAAEFSQLKGSSQSVAGPIGQSASIAAPTGGGTPIIPQPEDEVGYFSRLRSQLALECFDFGRLPTGESKTGAFAASQLRASGLLAQNEVPLCLLYWRSGQILFLDEWAIRRRVEQSMLAAAGIGPLQVAEGEALSQQFQAQLDGLKYDGEPTAREYFHAIPAAGFVPAKLVPTFFRGMNAWQDSLHPAQLRLKLWESFLTDPLDPASYGPPVNFVYVTEELVFYWTEFSQQQDRPKLGTASESEPELPGALTVDLITDGGAEAERLLSGATVTATSSEGKSYTARLKRVGGYETYLRATQTDASFLSAVTEQTTRSSVTLSALKQSSSTQVKAPTSGETPPIIPTRGASVQFELTGLPPDDYLVQVRAKGFKGASKKSPVKASQTIQVSFNLLAGTETSGIDGLKDLVAKRGRKGWKADFLPRGWWGKGWAVPGAVTYPPVIPKGWDPVTELPASVRLELAEIGQEVKEKYPKAAVDPGEVQLWLNPDHTPLSTPKEPYAFAQFGTGGAAVPLILTGTDRTLDRSIGLAKVEIDGTLDEQALGALGIAEVDALAGIWTGLLTQLLDVPEGAATSLVRAARSAIDTIKGTAKEWATEKPALAAALAEKGLADATTLANKRPEVLVEELKEKGVEVESWEAERLVKEARAAVPKSTWSVESIETLTKAQTEALTARGITTQEELKKVAESDPALVAQVTGLKVEEVATVVTAIEGARTEAVVAKTATLPVTQVVEAESTVLALGKAGFGTLGALANADLGAVTVALGGDLTAATQMVNLAKSRFTF